MFLSFRNVILGLYTCLRRSGVGLKHSPPQMIRFIKTVAYTWPGNPYGSDLPGDATLAPASPIASCDLSNYVIILGIRLLLLLVCLY